MNSLMANIFIFILHSHILVNVITEDVIEIGQSSCRYSGNHDANNAACYVDAFDISKLPTNECTSYIYDGITCTDDSKIIPTYSSEDLTNIKLLIALNSKVFLFYKININIWRSVSVNDSIGIEAQNLKAFFDEYPVAGLIFTGLDFPDDSNNFNIVFQSYFACIKNTNPNIKIGFYLKAATMMTYAKNESDWFDFSKLNDIMDFYLITFNHFNDCFDELYNGGTTPLNSDISDINTLENFGASLNVSKIAKEKIYLEFLITPTISFIDRSKYMHCEVTFDQYCKTDVRSKWCADNETTFYEKGVFARQHAAGWVGRDIDLVDRGVSCGCNGDQFISFHMILDAYNNKTMRTCDFKKP